MNLSDWLPHLLGLVFIPWLAILLYIEVVNCHLQIHVLVFFYSSCTTYTKMYRLSHIVNISVTWHHIRIYLWCHYIPDHSDVTGSSLWHHVDLWCCHDIIANVSQSLTTTKGSLQQIADPCIMGICTTIFLSIIS